MRLYELTNDYITFLDLIENEDIPEDVMRDTLEAMQGEIEVKADSIACILKSLEAEANAIREEEKRLAERRKKKERAYERLKDYLTTYLLAAGIGEVETPRNRISFRKSESVEIDPDTFFAFVDKHHLDDLLTYSKPTASKTAIKDAINSGRVVEGARIVTKTNLQLK